MVDIEVLDAEFALKNALVKRAQFFDEIELREAVSDEMGGEEFCELHDVYEDAVAGARKRLARAYLADLAEVLG